MRESHRDYHKSATKLIKELGISGWDAQAILTDPENEIRNYKDALGYIGLIKQAEAWEAHERSANPRRRKAKRNTGGIDSLQKKINSENVLLKKLKKAEAGQIAYLNSLYNKSYHDSSTVIERKIEKCINDLEKIKSARIKQEKYFNSLLDKMYRLTDKELGRPSSKLPYYHEIASNPRRRKAKRNTGDPVKQKVQSMFPILPEIDLWSIGTKYELRCPKCGAIELHPWIKDSLTIRGFKVTDEEGRAWSQCLVCAKYYDKKTLELTPEKYEPSKGWFTLD